MSIISITDKGKTITYHAHHMRDVIEPVKQYGMFGEQLNAKKKLHTLTFYTEDYTRNAAWTSTLITRRFTRYQAHAWNPAATVRRNLL